MTTITNKSTGENSGFGRSKATGAAGIGPPRRSRVNYEDVEPTATTSARRVGSGLMSELDELLAEAQAFVADDGDDEVEFELSDPASLSDLWARTNDCKRKLEPGDVDAALFALALFALQEVRGRGRYFWPGPSDFLKDVAEKTRDGGLTLGQAKGVLNTIVAGIRSQRKRWWKNDVDSDDIGRCIVCGLILTDSSARDFGVGDVCWQRILGNWG